MREIKFRAWDKTKNKFVDVKKLQWWPGGLFLNDTTKSIDGNPPNENIFGDGYKVIELMQYTGLKDTNGKEIYEGDILNPKKLPYTGESWVVEYRGAVLHIGGWLVTDVDTPRFEVVGNIYENPELIETNHD